MTKRFWMNFVMGGTAPTTVHAFKIDAETEAERLAKLNAGKKVFVLEAIRVVEIANVRWEEVIS